MEIVGLILTGMLGLALFDYCLMGYLPSMLGHMPQISDLGNDDRLIDDHRIGLHTNLNGRFIDSRVNNRKGYLAVVLTTDHFYVRANRLNYLFKVDVTDIQSYKIKKRILGRYLVFLFDSNGEERFVEVFTPDIEKWMECFNQLGITQNET